MVSTGERGASSNAVGDALASLPRLGLGLGLRHTHFEHILNHWPKVDWFEAISENFIDSGGRPGNVLRQIAERYPVALHGVSMSIGSTDPIDYRYLRKLKALADEISAVWVSDHLCWTGVQGLNSHDLLPLPRTSECLQHVIARVRVIQEVLQRPLIIENPSTYISYRQSEISEPDFLRLLCAQTGCGLLLDVNNVYVSCFNECSDPLHYLRAFPFESVVQMHLAGHQHCQSHIIDSHDQPVASAVWALFRHAWQATGGASTLLEWDGDIPGFDRCHAELLKAKRFMQADVCRSQVGPQQIRPEQIQPARGVSNPIDFLVPPAMASTVAEQP